MDSSLQEAPVIWITGGRSQLAEEIFARTGFGDLLRNSKGKVIAGGSAGMVMQAKTAMSWSTPVNRPEDNAFLPVQGLGLVRATVSPHLDLVERDDGLTKPRSHYFKPFLLNPEHNLSGPGIGVDGAAALAFSGNTFRVLVQDDAAPGVGVTVYHRRGDGLATVSFAPHSGYVSIDELTNTP